MAIDSPVVPLDRKPGIHIPWYTLAGAVAFGVLFFAGVLYVATKLI